MGTNTAIEWADHTWSPVRGCDQVSPGCDHCYAMAMAKRNPKTLGVWGEEGTRVFATNAQYVDLPRKWDKAAREAGRVDTVFVNSISDTFEDSPLQLQNHKGEPLWIDETGIESTVSVAGDRPMTMDDARAALFREIDQRPNLMFILLTKRPENIARFWVTKCEACSSSTERRPDCPTCGGRPNWRGNVFLMTTVEDQQRADERVPTLLARRNLCAGVGLSVEPMLGPLNLRHVYAESFANIDPLHGWQWTAPGAGGPCGKLDWVICGGESGHGSRPMHPDWARSLRDQCQAAGVPFFFKQWGEWGADAIDLQTGAQVVRQFASYLQWVNKASTWVRGGTCVDTSGNVLTRGSHFQAAHDGGRFPVAILHRVGKKKAGRLLDGREWSEFPACFGKEAASHA